MTSEAQVINPYDGSVIASVRVSSEQDVRDAIGRAVKVAPALAALPAYRRSAILDKTASLIDDQAADLARLMAQESGKPLKYARGEVARAVETFRFAADEAQRIHGETVPMDAAKGGVGKIGYYMRVPVGVVAAITPFNFPLNLVGHKVAPAVAAGCPIVLKPAPATPLTALRLAEIMLEAGLPEGAFEVVIGGADVGEWLTTDPRVAMITFTGSPGVARAISKNAGLRRLTLELGGNAATIIDEDANLTQAVSRNIMGGYAYSGQTCISVQRIYVHRSRYDEFRDRFVEAAGKLRLGDPLQESTDIGPVINDAAADRIESWVREALEGGARLATGGGRVGRMLPPVVLENVTESMKVMAEEVFGPVVSLVPFDDFEAALEAVDHSPYGLQAGIYTSNLNRAIRATQRLNVGG
ncbi:MAG: aldehyde dehydrogenase family protein, partial [Chloroflexota bacterium]